MRSIQSPTRHLRHVLSGLFVAAMMTTMNPSAKAEGTSSMTGQPLDKTWTITHVKGLDLSDLRDLTLRFDGTYVFGVAPCKTFTVSMRELPADGKLRFGPVKRTPHICDQATMIADRTYLDVLDTVDSFNIDDDGHLTLSRRDKTLVTAQSAQD